MYEFICAIEYPKAIMCALRVHDAPGGGTGRHCRMYNFMKFKSYQAGYCGERGQR